MDQDAAEARAVLAGAKPLSGLDLAFTFPSRTGDPRPAAARISFKLYWWHADCQHALGESNAAPLEI